MLITGCDGVNWIHLANGMFQCHAVVKTLMTLRFHTRLDFCWY
jgi:hypothetical protein